MDEEFKDETAGGPRVLVVEDDEARCAWFRERLRGSRLDVTCDVGVAVRWLAENPTAQRDALVVVHSLNYSGASRMVELMRAAGREAEHIPFHHLQTGLRM